MPVVPILASIDDINTHLPVDKLDASAAGADVVAAINLFEIDVNRLIKGYLSGVFNPTTLASWADPATTPQWIRQIAGRLIASFWYASRYSEDIPTESPYAQTLYTEAMSMLECVRTGEVIIPIAEAPLPNTIFSEAFFQPNSQSTPPKFSMDTVFG